jgi:hypothetical protein
LTGSPEATRSMNSGKALARMAFWERLGVVVSVLVDRSLSVLGIVLFCVATVDCERELRFAVERGIKEMYGEE